MADSFIRFDPKEQAQTPAQFHGFAGWFALVFAFGFLLAASTTGFGIARFIHRMYETLPTFEQLENIEPPIVSRVYARDGSLVHEFSIERRFWVPIDRIPPDLVNAVVAIEDRRFYKHWGIDLRRIAGAAIIDILHGGYAQGASTITQQLARNVYLTARSSMIRKIREALTAIQIESYYTKREIIELYLNQVYLGAGVYGVQAASRRYFSKDVSELTTNECAILAGTIQLPEHYRPDRPKNHDRLLRRRASVLRGMVRMGYLDTTAAVRIHRDSISCNPPRETSRRAPYLVDMIRQYVLAHYGEDRLYNGGLHIFSTLDPVAQDSAEQAMTTQLDSLQQRLNRMFVDSAAANVIARVRRDTFLTYPDSFYVLHRDTFEALPDSLKLRHAQASVIALEVGTGAIKVLIGGRDFSESKFNRAIQAKRQPGSAFKPIVYAAALQNGYTPASVVLDQPITLETADGLWRPENYNRRFSGPVTLRTALAKSINLVAIQVMMDIDPHTVIKLARRFGLRRRMHAVPSLAIGACEATPMEMAAAYAVFPNKGIYIEPYCIDSIVDNDGTVLMRHRPSMREILSPQIAYLMCDLMESVMNRGTGASARTKYKFHRPAGGKTGTTNDYSDAWFVGYTPQIACAVWTGVDERRSLGRNVTGARGALPIWAKLMRALHDSLPVRDFEEPSGIVEQRICSKSHKKAGKYCPSWELEQFLETTELPVCDEHTLSHTASGKNGQNPFGSGAKPRKAKKRRNPLMF